MINNNNDYILLEGKYAFANAVNTFSLAQSDLIVYATNIKLQQLNEDIMRKVEENQELYDIKTNLNNKLSQSLNEVNTVMTKLNDSSNEMISKREFLSQVQVNCTEKFKTVVTNYTELNVQIKNLTKTSSEISGIARKSSMISINALIEAARAGTAGKGFAVVAEEMTTLSSQTKKYINQVDDFTEVIKVETEQTQNSVSEVDKALIDYFEESDKLIPVLIENRSTVDKTINSISEISNDMKNVIDNTDKNSEIIDILSSGINFGVSLHKISDKMQSVVSKSISVSESDCIITTLANRLVEHANFLRNIIKNAGKLEKTVDHHNCAFGKWYDANKLKYQGMSEYNNIDNIHANFHSACSRFNNDVSLENAQLVSESSSEILEAFIILVDRFEKERNLIRL